MIMLNDLKEQVETDPRAAMETMIALGDRTWPDADANSNHSSRIIRQRANNIAIIDAILSAAPEWAEYAENVTDEIRAYYAQDVVAEARAALWHFIDLCKRHEEILDEEAS